MPELGLKFYRHEIESSVRWSPSRVKFALLFVVAVRDIPVAGRASETKSLGNSTSLEASVHPSDFADEPLQTYQAIKLPVYFVALKSQVCIVPSQGPISENRLQHMIHIHVRKSTRTGLILTNSTSPRLRVVFTYSFLIHDF